MKDKRTYTDLKEHGMAFVTKRNSDKFNDAAVWGVGENGAQHGFASNKGGPGGVGFPSNTTVQL